MVGMDKKTGKAIGREQHIVQSIEDILTTPKGTRVMRRDYGASYLAEDGSFRIGTSGVAIASEATELLKEYEPRISIGDVSTRMNGDKLDAIAVSYTDVEGGGVKETQVVFA
ncbi:GPW/gp25 family protein [Sphingosinicella soli]|uniref:IraD/Gp25-like domain-containing protein n=1 Tax=Sphingosinicella soli TaxID=333708 RepID=A0A7W7B2P4_9SPHN|nr:GPW/gp25 family protein [Sphingosinicella soli]MBB4632935.1 hypothetical protein [Sphingosinicella soli]